MQENEKINLKNLKIKPLTEQELDQVLALDNICLGGIWSLNGYKREIKNPNNSLLIMTIDSQSEEKVIGIGSVCFWGNIKGAHISLLAIHPNFQGQGLGKLLLTHLLEEVDKKVYKTVTLQVAKNNFKALNLYQQFGFKEIGRRKNCYKKTGEDALVLKKNVIKKLFKQP